MAAPIKRKPSADDDDDDLEKDVRSGGSAVDLIGHRKVLLGLLFGVVAVLV